MKARDLAQGRWPAILSRLGIDSAALDGHHHACPMNGEGKDRFRFADRNGTGSYFCACSEGDKGGMALLMCCKGWDYATAAKEVERVAGGAPIALPTHPPKDPAIALNAVRERLRNCGDDVTRYLRSRGLEVAPGLRQASLTYWQDGKKVGRFETMVARITDASGAPLTYHLTYLRDGKKANVDPSRKIMTPMRNTRGGAIRLYPGASVMGVAEGIETAISAKQLFGMPVWACGNSGLLEAFDPPEGVDELHVFGDNDANYAGQSAAYGLAHRMARRGIRCRVVLPKDRGDWNDALQARERAA